MKRLILTMTIAASIVSCRKEDKTTSAYNESALTEIFGEKEWQLTSIYTTPALLDINGDGENESELISTLQRDEKEKRMVFAPDGKVWVKKKIEDEVVINQNGNWKPDATGTYVTWLQEDGTLLKAKAVAFSGTEIHLTYIGEGTEVVYTLKTI
jgi:hypothetical protein